MSKRLREWRLSRARAARTEKPAEPPDPTEEFAKKAHDLDAVRKTVEDAAAVSAGFWLSYLFVLFYIGIAAGAVTHKDLLLENPVKLPFLNVELPLVAFFVLAPILFIVSHAYTLVHFVMLGAKVGRFKAGLRAQLPRPKEDHETREGLRRQLPSNIFVQFLAGPGDIRKGGLGLILKTIAWISLVIGPVLLLLLIQVQFLPYHLEWVTWVHRFALLADMTLLCFLWPAVLASRSEIQWPRAWRSPRLALLSLIPIGLAFTAATFPGEWLDDRVGKRQWIWPNPVTALLGAKDRRGQPKWTSIHDLLFNGEVDEATRQRKSPFSNMLVLISLDALEAAKIDDQKKLEWTKHSLVLYGRHLEGAVFDRADLRKADFEGAHVQGASFFRAQLKGAVLLRAHLQGASFEGAQLEGHSLDYAQLQGASLIGAQLQGASLLEAQLQGALLDNAQLQGAGLGLAQLQGASFDRAQLQGASLIGAQLQGASLDLAQLQGASLFQAKLQGASLNGAQLQGALLNGAQLQGALLNGAQLQGASLESARLQGASLDGARLQGADFTGSTFAGTDMRNAAVWRTNFDDASLTAVFEDGLKEIAGSKDEFAALKSMIMKEVPEGEIREDALKRIEKLNPDIFGPEASEQDTLEKGRVDTTGYRSALADQLKSLACSKAHDAPHIVRGLVTHGRIEDMGAQAPAFVEAILKPECPVSAALTDADKAALKELADSKP